MRIPFPNHPFTSTDHPPQASRHDTSAVGRDMSGEMRFAVQKLLEDNLGTGHYKDEVPGHFTFKNSPDGIPQEHAKKYKYKCLIKFDKIVPFYSLQGRERSRAAVGREP